MCLLLCVASESRVHEGWKRLKEYDPELSYMSPYRRLLSCVRP